MVAYIQLIAGWVFQVLIVCRNGYAVAGNAHVTLYLIHSMFHSLLKAGKSVFRG
jgi:hypothetical protein